jgi:2'-5' RNA ligase
MAITAGQFPAVYEALGIETQKLGCIMLDIMELDFSGFDLDDSDLYYSQYQDFVQGLVADHKAHATLLFGLMESGQKMKFFVDQVLEGWKQPEKIKIGSLGVFPGKEKDGTEYSCIVAHIEDDGSLEEGNTRLRLLPHIDTFPEGYKAHMTIAYVKPEATTEWLEILNPLVGKLVPTTELNYGS